MVCSPTFNYSPRLKYVSINPEGLPAKKINSFFDITSNYVSWFFPERHGKGLVLKEEQA